MRVPPEGYEVYPTDISPIAGKKLGIIGFGNQAQAWAMNLFDTGLEVYIGLRVPSPSTQPAIEKYIEVLPVDRVAKMCDIICALIPDEEIPGCLAEDVFPHIEDGAMVVLAHSFALFADKIKLPPGMDCIVLAPHGPGPAVREAFTGGSGLPAQLAMVQDHTGNAEEIALGLASGLGFTKGGLRRTDFRQEAIIDLFSEQAVLVGGVLSLVKQALETLKEAGYDPAISKVSCLDEIIGTASLFTENGLAEGLDKVSAAAAYGALKAEGLLRAPLREAFKILLDSIESGQFAEEFEKASSEGFPELRALIDKLREASGS